MYRFYVQKPECLFLEALVSNQAQVGGIRVLKAINLPSILVPVGWTSIDASEQRM